MRTSLRRAIPGKKRNCKDNPAQRCPLEAWGRRSLVQTGWRAQRANSGRRPPTISAIHLTAAIFSAATGLPLLCPRAACHRAHRRARAVTLPCDLAQESISDRSSIAGAETSAWTAPKRGVRGQGTWPKSYTDVGGSTATHPDAQPRAPPRITANVSEHLSKMIHEERAQRRSPVFHDVKPATREYEMVQHQQNLLARSKIPEKRTADNFFRVRERLKEVNFIPDSCTMCPACSAL